MVLKQPLTLSEPRPLSPRAAAPPAWGRHGKLKASLTFNAPRLNTDIRELRKKPGISTDEGVVSEMCMFRSCGDSKHGGTFPACVPPHWDVPWGGWVGASWDQELCKGLNWCWCFLQLPLCWERPAAPQTPELRGVWSSDNLTRPDPDPGVCGDNQTWGGEH